MKKTLMLTALILALTLPGNIGTKSADAQNGLTVHQALIMKHNLIVSKHTINWYHNKGHWTLHEKFKTCNIVKNRYSDQRADICYKARVTLEKHVERYQKIETILYPKPVYSSGGYDWDNMVANCEARGSGWYANTGNGFYFGPQFVPSTWHNNGGGPVFEMDGYGPHMTSYSIPYIKHVAYNVMQSQGPGAWPNCHGYL